MKTTLCGTHTIAQCPWDALSGLCELRWKLQYGKHCLHVCIQSKP
jgi:hypothetical protein